MKRSLMDMRKIVAPQRDMMASINTGVTDVPGHDRRGDALLPRPLRPPDPPGRPGRQLPGPALERDGHAPLDGVEPPQRRDEAADHHRHHLPAAQLPHRVLRAELRLPGARGIAPTWSFWVLGIGLELVDRRRPRRASSAGGAGWAARPSDAGSAAPVPAERRGRAGPAGRSAVWASYSVHQSSQPSGTGKPSCLRRSTRARTGSFCSRTSASVPASSAPIRPARPQRLLQAPGLAPGLDDGVGAVGDVGPHVGVALGQHVGGAQPAVVLVDAQEARLDLEAGRPRRRPGRWSSGSSPRAGGRSRFAICRSATPIMPMERSPM